MIGNENVPNQQSVTKGKWHVACSTRNQDLNELNQSIAFAYA